MTQPLPYKPSYESPAKDEQQTEQGLIETITKIQNKVYDDSHQAVRGVHAKCHGIIAAELTVADSLPGPLAQGLFAQPGQYPVIIRLSTIPGDLLDDDISVPRGLALKIIGVSGERVAGSEGEATQDFVLVNGPVFAKPDPKSFLRTLKLLAATTDKSRT
jgi:catalase